MNEIIRLELDEKDLEFIKASHESFGKQSVCLLYLNYYYKNLTIVAIEPSGENIYKFEYSARQKMKEKSKKSKEELDQLEFWLMMGNFSSYLERSGKIVLKMINFGEDYYLMTN